MALTDILKDAVELGKAMGVTLRHLRERPVTVEYPRDSVPLYPRFRGRHELRRYENGMERCIFCGDCEEACPTEAIVLGHEFALADYERRDFILTKEELLNPTEPNVIIRPE